MNTLFADDALLMFIGWNLANTMRKMQEDI